MSYYKTWMDKSEDASNRQEYIEYINRYYALEKVAYEKILGSYPDNEEFLNGTAAQLAAKLEFPKDSMDVFVGFVDGIKSSLTNGDDIDLEAIDDNYEIKLVIDYEKLYYNMRDAKADWLYNIPSWKNILTDEKRQEITRNTVMQISLIPIRSDVMIPAPAVPARSIRTAAVRRADI